MRLNSSVRKLKNSSNRIQDLTLVSLVGLAGWIIIALIFDFYYDLNDDVMIKDIIAGIYTGMPDAHNNQMMYPLSLILAGLYRLLPAVPWFGIFEQACFYISFVSIGVCLLSYLEKIPEKICLLTVESAVFFGCYLWELTMIQYTVVSGILVTAATLWLYTTPNDKGLCPSAFIKNNIPTIVLCVLSFNIRSEMFLLLCPFMAMAGICKWSEENDKGNLNGLKIFDPVNLKKYIGTVGIILVCVIATYAIDTLAYSNSEWKSFRRMFDARTQVYDFTGIPDYDQNIDFYEEAGITREQYDLLTEYNFALDKNIDAATLETIAAYVKSGEAITPRTPRTMRQNISEYVHNAIDFTAYADEDLDNVFVNDRGQHTPMNLIVCFLYLVLIIQIYCRKDMRLWVKLPVMLAFRSVSWIYAYSTQRVISRITHPMYMLEIVLLIAMILREMTVSKRLLKGFAYMAFAMVTILCLISVPGESRDIRYKQDLRAERNKEFLEIKNYMAEHEDAYYYMDVYSTVGYTEKIYEKDLPSKANWQLAGGWMYSSPLDDYKEARRDYAERYFVTGRDNATNSVENVGNIWKIETLKDK